MTSTPIKATELMRHTDGSVYHLHLHPEDIAPLIVLVGDPGRVGLVSQCFDRIDIKRAHRDFVTHTGWFEGQRLSVVSTGIGSGGIDIVMNELDALVNVDFKTSTVKPAITALTFLRMGTCGAIQEDIEVGSIIASSDAVGQDGVLQGYLPKYTDDQQAVLATFKQALSSDVLSSGCYVGSGSADFVSQFQRDALVGYTFTCPGFYAAQQRALRVPVANNDLFDRLADLSVNGHRCLNLEMETALIYGLANVLGHRVCSLSVAIGNRVTQAFLSDQRPALMHMIELGLQQIVR